MRFCLLWNKADSLYKYWCCFLKYGLFHGERESQIMFCRPLGSGISREFYELIGLLLCLYFIQHLNLLLALKAMYCFTVYFHTFIALLQLLSYLFYPDKILRIQASIVLIFKAGKWSSECACGSVYVCMRGEKEALSLFTESI